MLVGLPFPHLIIMSESDGAVKTIFTYPWLGITAEVTGNIEATCPPVMDIGLELRLLKIVFELTPADVVV